MDLQKPNQELGKKQLIKLNYLYSLIRRGEERRRRLQSLKPSTNGLMQTRLDSDEVGIDLVLEGQFPRINIRYLPIEDTIISLIPDAPSTHHEDLHEEGGVKQVLSSIELLMNIHFLLPSNT